MLIMILEQKYKALLAGADAALPLAQMRLCFEVLALAGAIDRDCASRLGAHQLSEGKFVLLYLLARAPDGLSPYELAEQAGVTRATVTGLLDGLERSHLVQRHAHPEDRRRLTIRLSAEGRKMSEKLVAQHNRWIGSLFADFTPEEGAELSRLLDKAFARTDAGRQGAQAGAHMQEPADG
ncbi:MAG: MarR family winged helix-turn-helix transcriptional regulator [Xanthobacter sp.]